MAAVGRKIIDPQVRQTVVERLRAGVPARDLAAEFKLHAETIRKWRREETDEPKGVAPPTAEGGDRPYKSSGGRRPITEKTAGMLVSGIFCLCAIVDGESWLLTPIERDSLASPLADSLRALPAGVADTVNTYAAPTIFGSALITIVQHKVRIRNAKRKAPPPPPRPFVPPVAGPQPPRNPGAPSPFAAAQASNASNGHVDATLAEALAAARSGLSSLDAIEEAEAVFS